MGGRPARQPGAALRRQGQRQEAAEGRATAAQALAYRLIGVAGAVPGPMRTERQEKGARE